MRSPWTIGRLISGALSMLLLGFGINFLVDGQRRHRDFERWQTAKPVDGEVDFSAPGHFNFVFDQTCSSSHGETITLRVPPQTLQGTTAAQLLAGLKARLEITESSGTKVVESADSKVTWDDQTLDGAIPVFAIAPFRKGEYKVTVTVADGAPALGGISQRLEGRYLLCGLERLPATIATTAGVVITGIGSLIGAVVLFLVGRHRRTRQRGE